MPSLLSQRRQILPQLDSRQGRRQRSARSGTWAIARKRTFRKEPDAELVTAERQNCRIGLNEAGDFDAVSSKHQFVRGLG